MTLSRRAREWVIVAVLLALPLLVLRANMKAPSDLNPLDRALLRVSAPIQTGLLWVLGGIKRGVSRYGYLVHVNQENEQLHRENAALKAELETARREAARAAGFEDLLGIRGRIPVESVAARVVGAETSAYFRVARLRLDHGPTGRAFTHAS